MKKVYLLLAFSFAAFVVPAQTLISYGNSTISKEEFLRAYNKNKPAGADKEKSLKEYAELYTNFKLKVKAAEAQRIDTLPQIVYDVDNFRTQIIENYLSDDKGMKKLQAEAFTRSQKDIHVLHFFVPISPTATPADTLEAFNAINNIYKQLKSGNDNYNAIATNAGTAKQSDLGFITVFTVPYEYENIIYGTKPGGVTLPYQSKKGWHIFKNLEERASPGRWKVAQILFSFPPGANEDVREAVKKNADSVYGLLQNGLSFGAAAKAFSNDKLTYLTEGELPEFGTGKYSATFENEILKIKNDGQMTKPFATEFGYHIVKRLSFTPTPVNNTDETFQFSIKQQILQDARIKIEKEKFANEIVIKTGFKKSPGVSEDDLYRYADSVVKNNSLRPSQDLPISKKTIATFTNGLVKGSEWLMYIREYHTSQDLNKGETIRQLWKKFIPFIAVDYYKKDLEKYNPEFKIQMQEFKEGNMLFEIMEQNVWNKATTDSAGLLKYYTANKIKYQWAASADLLIFNCSSVKIADETMAALKSGQYWKTIAVESNSTVQADSGRYELAQILGTNFNPNPVKDSYSPVVTNSDGSASFVKYLQVYEANLQRSFDDAKGLVINDYQNVLEQNWLAQLKLKYPVKINENLFKQLKPL
ncbi:MAG: peptidylprolyl isomerase [Ferruginibacter sp.]